MLAKTRLNLTINKHDQKTKTYDDLPMLQTTLRTNQNGEKSSSSTFPTISKEVSTTSQMTEKMLSANSNKNLKLGRRNPKISTNDSTRGWTRKEKNDRMVCVKARNHLTAFWKLCRNSIVPKYLTLETISQVSIQSRRGPHKRDAVASRKVVFSRNRKVGIQTGKD